MQVRLRLAGNSPEASTPSAASARSGALLRLRHRDHVIGLPEDRRLGRHAEDHHCRERPATRTWWKVASTDTYGCLPARGACETPHVVLAHTPHLPDTRDWLSEPA